MALKKCQCLATALKKSVCHEHLNAQRGPLLVNADVAEDMTLPGGGLVQQATKDAKGVDDIVRALYKRQLEHKEQNSNDFHGLVSEITGAEERDKVRTAMEGGKVIVPYDDCFAKYGLELVRHDVEQFEPGRPSRPDFSVGLSLSLGPSLVLECPEIPMMANLSVKVGLLAKYDCNMAEGARPFALGVYLAYRNCSEWRILTYLPPDNEATAPDLSDMMTVESFGARRYGAAVSDSSGDDRKARKLMRRIDRIDLSDSDSQTYAMVANGE
ncbi:hypothetical protein SCAR479_13467 [Seiridium cardinale]|uniref:Uncharacterized protein n=1 Tax=Seiridium cardinale TaxID=138064 RepID=A0ABR2X819_9PEZI